MSDSNLYVYGVTLSVAWSGIDGCIQLPSNLLPRYEYSTQARGHLVHKGWGVVNVMFIGHVVQEDPLKRIVG